MDYFYTFGGEVDAPTQPSGALLEAGDGNFYGFTRLGGRYNCGGGNNCGTVFKLTPAGVFSIIHELGATLTGGFQPSGPLIEAPDGSLLGLAARGGDFDGGVIYRLTKAGAYSVVYSFGGTAGDGIEPIGRLARGADGTYYGVTVRGGANVCSFLPSQGQNCGSLFRLAADLSSVSILYSFGGSPAAPVTPRGLVFNPADGNFYGASERGGAAICAAPDGNNFTGGCGTLFRYVPGGAVTVIKAFSGTDGFAPVGPPVVAADGTIYGTTIWGGNSQCGTSVGCGTVYRINTAGQFSLLHRFALIDGKDGHAPGGYPILGSDGNLYGITIAGGDNGNLPIGTAWRLTPAGVKTVLASFGPFESSAFEPIDGMAEVQPGVFFGAIRNNSGVINATTRTNGRLYKLTIR